MSNELEVTLPLNTKNIVLPPSELRQADEEVYREFITVEEGPAVGGKYDIISVLLKFAVSPLVKDFLRLLLIYTHSILLRVIWTFVV